MKIGDKIEMLENGFHCTSLKKGVIVNITTMNDVTFTAGGFGFMKEHLDIGFKLIEQEKEMAEEEIFKYSKTQQDDYGTVSEPKDTKEVGNKLDAGKPMLSLIPKEAMWGMANAFTYGAKKYSAHNFKQGIAYSRLADAALRHITAYMDGENIDEESGNCHLDHALASLAMLKYMSVNKQSEDDRFLSDEG